MMVDIKKNIYLNKEIVAEHHALTRKYHDPPPLSPLKKILSYCDPFL